MRDQALVAENDLESFLLCTFSRKLDNSEEVVRTLGGMQLTTWSGVRGVLLALHWLGVRTYWDDNAALINEQQHTSPGCWLVTLDWDLAQARGKTGVSFLEKLSASDDRRDVSADFADANRRQQTDKGDVFKFAIPWLQAFSIPDERPASVSDFLAMGEVLFWVGHLHVSNDGLAKYFDSTELQRAWDTLPPHLFARFANGALRCFRLRGQSNLLTDLKRITNDGQ